MKTINRRLRKLEEGFGLVPETEDDRRLRERLEAGRRRLAAARASGEYSGPAGQGQVPDRADSERKAISGMTMIEILQQGRERARARPGPLQPGVASQGTEGLAVGDHAITGRLERPE